MRKSLIWYIDIVNRDKKVVKKFEFDPAKEDAFDICNKMLSLQLVALYIMCCQQDYQKKIDECKLKIETARSEVVGDEDIDRLQKDLDEELKREALLREELRALVAEMDELDEQRVSIEKQRQRLKKLEEEEEKEQRKLSFYASVTKIIPDLESNSKICGHIVNRDKKVVKKFEFDPAKEDAFDICNKTWKMIDQ